MSPALGAPPTDGAMPIGARIAATFTAPGALAEAVRTRPRWVDVLLISTAVAVLAAAMLPAEFFLAAADDAVTRRGTPVEITSPPEEIVRWGRRLAMLNALVGHPLIAFAVSGVLSLIFTVLPSGSNTYTQHLALTSHALLIPAVGTLLGVALMLATGAPTAEISLALLVPVDALSLINPFTIWMLAVLAIGVSVLDPKRSRRATLAILVGGYIALVLAVALAV